MSATTAGAGAVPAEKSSGPDEAQSAVAQWIDAHCHVQETYLGADERHDRDDEPGREVRQDVGVSTDGTSERSRQVLVEAAATGVIGVICVGTDVSTSRAAVELAGVGGGAVASWVRATVGVHPHEAAVGTDDLRALLDDLRAGGHLGTTVVGIGECGLDYHYDHAPRQVQRRVFAEQIALAHQLGLALVVHTRDAWADTLDVLRSEGVPERTVVHCFTGGADEARRVLDLGGWLSFSGIVTFKNAADVREAAVLAPLDRILVETDAPFLAPVPFRGKRNRPAWVGVVGAAVAALRSMEAIELASATMATTKKVFGLG